MALVFDLRRYHLLFIDQITRGSRNAYCHLILWYQTVLVMALRMEVLALWWLVVYNIVIDSVMMMHLAMIRRRDATILLFWGNKAALHQLSTLLPFWSYFCAMVTAYALCRNLLHCPILICKFGLRATWTIGLARITVLNQWNLFICSTSVKEIYSLIAIMNVCLVSPFCWCRRSSLLESFLVYDTCDSCPILYTLDPMLSSCVTTTFAVSSFIVSLRCFTYSSTLNTWVTLARSSDTTSNLVSRSVFCGTRRRLTSMLANDRFAQMASRLIYINSLIFTNTIVWVWVTIIRVWC